MRNKKVIANLLCMTTMLVAVNASATVYQWTDSQGNVHYSDTPNDNNAKPVEINSEPLSPNSDIEQRNQALIEKQRQDKVQQQKDAAKQADLDNQKKYNTQVVQLCATSKNNLKLLQQTGRRAYTIDAKGEYHYFNAEERQQEITRLEAQIKQYCQ